MGRSTGHLALGIGKAAPATVTVIPEEFRHRRVKLDEICDIVLGAIIKGEKWGRGSGVAVLAESLVEAMGEEGILDKGAESLVTVP